MPSRIFQPVDLICNTVIQLDQQASHHLVSVLRVKAGDELTVFNGRGGEFSCIVTHIVKKQVTCEIKEYIPRAAESSLELCLAQGISRGEKMDYTIQKAVELGVKKIIPLFTERCTVKLDAVRQLKRLQHWQAIIIGACEQSGRNQIPQLSPFMALEKSWQAIQADWRFVLSPLALANLKDQSVQKKQTISLLIGPEGGLSEQEIQRAMQHGFVPLKLGPRVLRTETAAIAAIIALQYGYGDMG